MTVKDRLKRYLKFKNVSQADFAESIGVSHGYVGAIRKSIQPEKVNKIVKIYPDLNIDWLLTGKGNMSTDAIIESINPTTIDVLNQLKRIKGKTTSEGHLVNNSTLVPVEQYRIPLKGQAGLKKAFFSPDEYIEENFEKEIVYVRPNERAVYHKIEVDGHSMPGVLDPGDWAHCIDIPRNTWLEKDTFKPNKVYCLFHRTLGILFKRISKVDTDRITLSSDNSDKVEYPDMEFDLMEFSKILLVKRKEVDL